jgi:mRNA interferase RelE/StbE
LRKLKDPNVLARIEATIVALEQATHLSEIRNIRKLKGFKTYFRIKLGEYRIGLELMEGGTIRLILVLHRKDIYNEFP